MTDRKLMQQALDALEYAADQCKPEGLYGCNCLICKTILALRDSLAQSEQELVFDCPRCGHCCPQQTWVGLTDEERQELAAEQHNWESLCFAVEAKIKQRNI